MLLSLQDTMLVIIIIAAVTFLIRGIPFILFPSTKKTPKYILYLGSVLPSAIIGMLIIYCLKNITIFKFPFGIPEAISIILIIAIHTWKRNTLLSIGGGTVLYMFLVQVVFK
jgi:branched-subunit amino acid transport protein AzlD